MVPDGLTINPGNLQPVTRKTPDLNVNQENKEIPDNAGSDPAVLVNVQKDLDSEALEKLAEELNENFKIFNAAISFSVDKDTSKTVITILDRETEEVIREIPPEELLELAAKLTEIIGRLVDETV